MTPQSAALYVRMLLVGMGLIGCADDAVEASTGDAGISPVGTPGPERDASPPAPVVTDAAAAPDAARADTDAGDASLPEPPVQSYQLDCGASGIVLESAGPPANRVNYVIVGDGYIEAELSTRYVDHLKEMMRVRFTPEAEPYLRYRKFINVCALKVASPHSGIGETRGDSAFGGYGNDQSRLGYVQEDKVQAAIARLLPASIEVDWSAAVLNSDRWWNAGGRMMVWSGAHPDAGLAALHEGGHAFQLLADEYGGDCAFSGRETDMRVNVTMDRASTAGKWSKWLDFTHTPGTGMQGVFEGAQYCDRGAYRPSQDSVMNSLWRSSYFNAISREQAVRLIYEVVRPIDEASSRDIHTPSVLSVRVVDPAVIQVAWYIDDDTTVAATGAQFDVAARGLSPGSHRIRARAFDDTPWVRGDRSELEQTETWTIEVP